MSTRERPRPPSETEYDALTGDVTDADVEAFLHEQAVEEDEAREKEKKPGFFNLQTGSGFALIGIGLIYLLQQIGLFPLGFSLGGLVALLPWLAGVLIVLTGFGVLSWSPARRRRRARAEALRRAAQRQREQASRRNRNRTMGRPSDAEAARQLADSALRQAEAFGTRAFEGARRAFDKTGTAPRSRASTFGRERSRRLTKSKKNKWVLGVSAGIAKYLGIDPIIVRLLFVVGTFFNGASIPIYFVLALVMPKDDGTNDGDDDDDPVVRVTRG
ncbi:MAG TPA: PspC domain-containing protein [Rhodothermales bacterium]|nr:PspC domain-containing protein [Rhodothermales bacterium]